MPEAGESELLFFDTFSHENTEELNLDLVQFPRPVLIHEVRVVPLGTRVTADVPGGTRLGATNPSSFKLDLFVNNLTKPNAATFEKLGVLDYKGNDNIQLPLEVSVPTDGLIIKGWYSAITLAVYGSPTTVTKDRVSPPPPPPPRSKAQGDCLMVIPPAVIDNVQQPQQTIPPQQSVNSTTNKTSPEWDPAVKPGGGTPIAASEHSFPQSTGNSQTAPAASATSGSVPAAQKGSGVEMFHDIDERFSGVQPTSQAAAVVPQPDRNPPDKKAPQVELDEHGEAKFPKGEYESDELFEAYLREKDRKREEKERERAAERERERAERYRKESRSRTPDRGHSRDHTRSSSRSRSRSPDREYRRSSRDREYRDGGNREYREHRDSDWEYRERDRYSDRGRTDSRDQRDSRERDRRDSRERDRRDSRERDKDGKDRNDSRDREHNKSQIAPDKSSSRDRGRDRDRRDSGDRGRDRTPERNKSPKSRTPRRSRSRTPPSRRSRSRSRERERNYDRDRGRDYRDKDRDRDKDYDKNRDRDKERDSFRERDKDYDRDYRSGRDSRYDREKDKDRDREGWNRDRREVDTDRQWDKGNRELRDVREQPTLSEGEWDRPRDQHQTREPVLMGRDQHLVREQPPTHPQHAIREPIPVRDSHNQRNQWHPDDIVPPQPQWNREVPPSAVDNTVQVWPHDNRVQQDGWGRNPGRVDEMQGTWAPPPQAVQQAPPPFPVIPDEPIPPNTVIVPLPEEELYEGMPGEGQDEGDDMYTPLSDGEIEEEPAYSDISSDENFLESLNDEEYQARLAELQNIDDIEDPWNYAISSFNPYQCDLTSLDTFTDPSLTPYELEKLKLLGQEPSTEPPEDAHRIKCVVDKFKEAPHTEEWIESIEGLIFRLPSGLSYLISKADAQECFKKVLIKNILNALVSATFEGLDLQKAVQQPLTAYKVRHLKMGIRLAGALCACDTYVSLKLITAGVQHKLIDLFESQHMSSSVKIYIIKALDSSVNLKDGMDWFLGKHPLQLLGNKTKENEDMPYKRYLKMMMKKQMSRVTVALTSLLRKVHVYELLNKFTAVLEVIQDRYDQWLAENTSFPDSKPPPASKNDSEVDMDTDVEPDMPLIPDNMTADDIENIISCLQEVTKVILNTDNILGQPPKILHNSRVFRVIKKPVESTQMMYHMFSSTQLLEGVFVLLSSPVTFNHNGVFNAIKDLLMCMISTQPGLLYMCSKYETVNGIIRALTQTTGYTEDDDEGSPRGPHPAHLLGLQLIYYLQTLQNIDRLRDYHTKGENEKDLDDAEPLGLLHCLYMMTFTPQGREAVVHVFTMADNLGALLPFIELSGDDVMDVKIKRSVCHSYTVLLLVLIVRHSGNVQYLEKYSQQLLSFSQHEPASNKTVDKITELQDWLSPLKKVSTFKYDSAVIVELVKSLKHYSDEVTDLPKGLVTALRIIKYLCLEPENPVPGYTEKEGPVEMKYKYAVIEVFSADAMPVFQTILQKLGEMLTRPFQQTLPKMGMPRMVIMYTVTPVLSLVKAVLQYLISVRGPAFADMTLLNSLFQIHTVMCSVSHSGTLSPEAQCIQNTVVDILMTYTQPALEADHHTEEALAKSLWTVMCKELLKYVITAPYTFLSGLILTSELLPLPLPIQSKEPMTTQEVCIAVNQRKLWSAHLHPLSNQIQDILQNLSGSACQPLQQLLRRVCWQLADLAGPSALMVVRCLLETVTESMDASIEKNMSDAIRALPPEERPLVEIRSSAETAKILNLLAFLMNQPPVKTAFIYLSSGKSKLPADEKQTKVLLRLARLLNIVNGDGSPHIHIQAQESIVSIFQSLCDLEVTMIPAENNMAFIDQLANSLPPRDQMAIVCEALLLHIDQRDHNFSSILPALRTLALLMLHDFGFYHVKIALEKVPRAFYNLFQQINNTFSKDSSDCIATLSSAIELLQFLVALPEAPEGEEQTVPFERTYLISYKDLREVLMWNKDPVAGHPLSDLDTLLHEYAKEEETLKAVYESVNLVVSILKSDEDQPKPDMFEPNLPEPETLQGQFEMRSIYLITDDEDDRLSATYWLATPMGEDTDDKEETIRVDFDEMAHKYCQDFDLRLEIEKGAVQSDPPIIKRRRSRIGRRLDTINTSKMRGKNGKFVAPMRGRGYGRVMPINKNDMFRSRPQNTSRPPSMHVDDFIKMELQGGSQPQIGPTGMNPHLTKFREQFETARGRGFQGRGRGRGGASRGGGRFFSPPGGYQRRDNSPNISGWGNPYDGHMENPNSRGGGYRGRGSATGGINPRGSPPKPPPSWGGRPPRQDFNQGGFHHRGSAGDWGGQRNDRGGRGFNRGWGGGGAWRGKDERRFMPPPGTPPFYGRRENKHQRSFTK